MRQTMKTFTWATSQYDYCFYFMSGADSDGWYLACIFYKSKEPSCELSATKYIIPWASFPILLDGGSCPTLYFSGRTTKFSSSCGVNALPPPNWRPWSLHPLFFHKSLFVDFSEIHNLYWTFEIYNKWLYWKLMQNPLGWFCHAWIKLFV